MHALLKNPIATVVFGVVIAGLGLYYVRQSNVPVLTNAARGFSG
jgi:hypothetical protein